jgi:hypothetical protein
MKFTTAFIAATTVAAASAQADGQRNLATLAEKWNITDPDFTFDSNTFTLSFPVTNFVASGMAKYSLWTAPDCLEGGIDISGRDVWANQELVENAALAAKNTQADYDALVDSGAFDAGLSADITMEFDPQTISADVDGKGSDPSYVGIFSEAVNDQNQMTAQVRFCVRFGLWTDPLGVTTPVEVNFIETLITLVVDLTDGFEIGTINVEAKDRLVRTANQAYEVRGYECSLTDTAPANNAATRNQGEIIHVCVTPEDEAITDGIFMRSIDDFAFTRDGGVRQVAIQDGAEAGNLLTSYNADTCTGAQFCRFSTILFAQFYSATGTVSGEGVASMQFGGNLGTVNTRRTLRESRDLQGDEAGAAEFDLNFDVAQADDRVRSTSGANSASIAAAMSMVAVVAAMV